VSRDLGLAARKIVAQSEPELFMRNGESVGNAARCGHFILSHFGVFRHSVVSAKASQMRSNPRPDCVSRVWPAKLMNNPGEALGTRQGKIVSTVGAAHTSVGKSYDPRRFSGSPTHSVTLLLWLQYKKFHNTPCYYPDLGWLGIGHLCFN
jgi:hypothetical protein